MSLSEFSSPKQYSRNSIQPRFLIVSFAVILGHGIQDGQKNCLKKKFLAGYSWDIRGPYVGISLKPQPWDVSDKNSLQGASFCCFSQGMAAMSCDLGRDVPESEKLYARIYTEQMDAAIFGGRTAEGHAQAFPRPRQPLFAVPAVRGLESACRVSILWGAVTVPAVCFSEIFGDRYRGSAAVCDQNPPRPSARYRKKILG